MTVNDYKESTGKTFRQLSEESKIPIATLHRICHGKRPNFSTAEKILRSMPLSLEDLLRGGNGK